MMVRRGNMEPTERDVSTSPDKVRTTSPVDVWPPLPQAAWSDTCATLQLWLQVVGKIRLALVPPINHCWNVTLYPAVRGLTTMPMPHGARMLQIDFDFLSHQLLLHTSDGGHRSIALQAMPVAKFYRQVVAALGTLGTPV